MNTSEFFDPVVKFILLRAKEICAPTRVFLFGSRARGTSQERSDYDFAFEMNTENEKNWSRFFVEVDENAPTLHKIDLVNLNSCRPELRNKILEEGVLIYEE